MSVVLKTIGKGATLSGWLQKISQHRVRSTAQQCTEGVGSLMGNQQWHTSTRHKVMERKLDKRKTDPEEQI